MDVEERRAASSIKHKDENENVTKPNKGNTRERHNDICKPNTRRIRSRHLWLISYRERTTSNMLSLGHPVLIYPRQREGLRVLER